MKSILTTTALASALLLGTFAMAPAGMAQEGQPTNKECVGENCPGGMQGGEQDGKRMRKPQADEQMQNKGRGQDQVEDQSDDQNMPRKKRAEKNRADTDVDVDVRTRSEVRTRSQASVSGWRFDPNRHQRRRSKSATFRFYFDGYWYPQPYWQIYVGPRNRISCGEGRSIVAERFNRVRVVECNGRTYTYLGRRQGDTYRILLNARSGRIVGRTLI